MKRYQVEVSASNTIHKEASTLKGVAKILENCQGRTSVIDTKQQREITSGNVQEALSEIYTMIENQ